MLSLRTTRSCLLDSTSASSIPPSLTKALLGAAGFTVKWRLKTRDEVLIEIAISSGVIGNAVKSEFLRQPSLNAPDISIVYDKP